ncbi:MAG: hypothetical protein IPG17_08860 [Sandaracinaceae bacterium]|nr:hypothetical protein [Sandaracinaceae bacterium]
MAGGLDDKTLRLDDKTLRVFGELFHGFSVGWLSPLMSGGVAKATRALPPHALDTFAHSRPTDMDADQRLYEAFHRIAAQVAPVGTLPYPDRGTWALAMAAHNLATLTDPLLDAAFRRSSRAVVRGWADQLIEAAGEPMTRGEALLRHALLLRVTALQREDRVIKNWAYTYRYWGRQAPANVVALPRVRFVRETVSQTPLSSFWSAPDLDEDMAGLHQSMQRLAARSPLTALLGLGDTPDFRFTSTMLAVLSDPALRHGVAHHLVRTGLGTAAARIGAALRELTAMGAPPALLGTATAFVMETAMMAALDRQASEVAPNCSDMDARLFWAVLPEALGGHDALDPLEVVPPSDRRRLGEWAVTVAAQLDPDTAHLAHTLFQRVALPLTATQPASGPAASVVASVASVWSPS